MAARSLSIWAEVAAAREVEGRQLRPLPAYISSMSKAASSRAFHLRRKAEIVEAMAEALPQVPEVRPLAWPSRETAVRCTSVPEKDCMRLQFPTPARRLPQRGIEVPGAGRR